jgi:diaminobutyrate-2-oxoglutarate transaminase
MVNDGTFVQNESDVRTYCRSFPTVFAKASGHLLHDEEGKEYIDFFAGAGSLNYGHNNPKIKEYIINYLHGDGVIHSLDMYTTAKRGFIEDFVQYILEPRNLPYKLQFPGPTGTNAVEAALKLARKITRRWNVIAFTHGFHGMTLGSLAATSNPKKRAGAGVPLSGVTMVPFDGFLGPHVPTLQYIEKMLTTPGSGIEPPAAFLVEVVQGEGGLNTASSSWLQGLQELARSLKIPLIIDDIQAGCGRTGSFFSFEDSQIVPDIVCLSKSLSGFGLPFSLVLLKPELDVWAPGEHNGTFRGNNLGFIGASAAIREYWQDRAFQESIAHKSAIIRQALDTIVATFPSNVARVKGKGMMIGIEVAYEGFADSVSQRAFAHGLIIETCGTTDQVVKLLPPLTISEDGLKAGLDILAQAFRETLEAYQSPLGIDMVEGPIEMVTT